MHPLNGFFLSLYCERYSNYYLGSNEIVISFTLLILLETEGHRLCFWWIWELPKGLSSKVPLLCRVSIAINGGLIPPFDLIYGSKSEAGRLIEHLVLEAK